MIKLNSEIVYNIRLQTPFGSQLLPDFVENIDKWF